MEAGRRNVLGGLAALALGGWTRIGRADPPARLPAVSSPDVDIRDVRVEGDRVLGRRFMLVVPKHLGPDERAPLLVLLHGLGETGSEELGVRAWVERYGLVSSYARLRRPPIRHTSRRLDLTDARLGEINAALSARSFRGLVIACPFTPNVNRLPNPRAALDGYARWIVEVVVPRARREAPAATGTRTGLDGCSLGGYVGLEVFLRKPDPFDAWGSVQAAFGAQRAAGFAEALARTLARAAPRPIHIETSSADPFRRANESFADALTRAGVANELLVLPGPHDQPWLREVGTLEMLRWYDRVLR